MHQPLGLSVVQPCAQLQKPQLRHHRFHPWWDGKDETVPDKVRQQWLDTAALYAQYDNYYSIEKTARNIP